MSRSIFGWSYPPGCSGPPDEYEGPCFACGQFIDNCICPECPECGEVGNPSCYGRPGHGLRLTNEQIDGLLAYQEQLYQWEVLNEIQSKAEYQAWLDSKSYLEKGLDDEPDQTT